MTRAGELERQLRESDNPIVSHVVSLFDSGACTWEEALMLAVIELARANKVQHDILLEYMMHGLPPIIVPGACMHPE